MPSESSIRFAVVRRSFRRAKSAILSKRPYSDSSVRNDDDDSVNSCDTFGRGSIRKSVRRTVQPLVRLLSGTRRQEEEDHAAPSEQEFPPSPPQPRFDKHPDILILTDDMFRNPVKQCHKSKPGLLEPGWKTDSPKPEAGIIASSEEIVQDEIRERKDTRRHNILLSSIVNDDSIGEGCFYLRTKL